MIGEGTKLGGDFDVGECRGEFGAVFAYTFELIVGLMRTMLPLLSLLLSHGPKKFIFFADGILFVYSKYLRLIFNQNQSGFDSTALHTIR